MKQTHRNLDMHNQNIFSQTAYTLLTHYIHSFSVCQYSSLFYTSQLEIDAVGQQIHLFHDP